MSWRYQTMGLPVKKTWQPIYDLDNDGSLESDLTFNDLISSDHPYSSDSSASSATSGGRMRPMGRGETLKRLLLTSGQLKSSAIYKPVGLELSVGGAVAVPGQCHVQDSWRTLTNAPVAYQMQKMQMLDECWPESEESVSPCSSPDKIIVTMRRSTHQQGRQEWLLSGSSDPASVPDTAAGPPALDYTINKKKKQRKSAFNNRLTGLDTMSMNEHESSAAEWEPMNLDAHHHPDLSSPTHFPLLGKKGCCH